METKNYVPLEIARRLREKGYHADRYAANEMAQPTYEQAVGWLKMHGKEVYTIGELVGKSEQVKYRGVILSEQNTTVIDSYEPTNEQALNRAIIKALEEHI